MNNKNDWFAANLNKPEFGLDEMFAAGLTPSNTSLQSKDYYLSNEKVRKKFTDPASGKFDEDAFNFFYDGVSRSYNEFSTTDFENKWLQNMESSPYDIFALDKPNAFDATVKMVRNNDPQRHQVGMSGVNIIGDASWDEREVAQANFVRDENGNKLNWTPNGKWVTGALFGPTLALATWDEDGTHEENGRQVTHRKGQQKYDENGDPYYEILGNRSHYGKDVLHITDVVTKDDAWINQFDFLDSDSLDKSIGKTIFKTATQIGLWAIPHVGPVLGGVKALMDLTSVLPIVGKSIDGLITGNTDDKTGQFLTRWENTMARFDKSQTAKAKEKQWSFENIGDMISSSAGQLYSQRLIGQIPLLFKNKITAKNLGQLQKVGQRLSLGYMALTSAEDSYSTLKDAGVNDRLAGAGFLLSAAALYGLMDNEYFKNWLFKDSAINFDPEMRFAVREWSQQEAEKLATELGIKAQKVVSPKTEQKFFKRWWEGIKNFIETHKDKIPTGKAYPTTLAFANHALNEGIEEVMEENVVDIYKGILEGVQALGMDISDDTVDKVDFGWSPEEIMNRYLTSFVGGAIGGAVFEGLTRWENHWKSGGADRLLDKDAKNRIIWYLSNGYGKDLRAALDREYRKGHLGSTSLSMNGKLTEDSSGKSVWTSDAATDSNNQNTQMYYRISDALDTIEWQASQWGILDSDKDVLDKSLKSDELTQTVQKNIQEAAEKEGISVDEFYRKHRTSLSQEMIAQSAVSDAIFSDVYWLKNRILGLQKDIDDTISKIREGEETDKNKADVDERIEKNQNIKRMREEQKAAQKEYNEILSGKHAYEYISLDLFSKNKALINAYLDNTKFSKEEYAMAMYGEVYDGLDEETQNSITNEYNQYLHDSHVSDNIRRAHRIHNKLTEIVNKNMLQKQSELTGFSMDPSMQNYTFWDYLKGEKEKYEQSLPILQQQFEALLETNPEEAEKVANQINAIKAEQGRINNLLENPEPVLLSRRYDLSEMFNESELIPTTDETRIESAKNDLDLIIKYLTRLKENKIIFAQNNPIVDNQIENIKSIFSDNASEILTRKSDEYARRYAEDEFLNELSNAIAVGDFSEIDEKSIPTRDLIEIYNALKVEQLRNKSELTEDEQKFLNDFEKLTQEEIDEKRAKFEELYNNADSSFIGGNLLLDVSNPKHQELQALLASIADVLDNKELAKQRIEEAKKLISDNLVDSELSEEMIRDLFGEFEEMIDKIDQIKQMRTELKPSPITDLLQFLQIQIGDSKTPVLDYLDAEYRSINSPDALNEYVIDNDSAVRQLKAIKNLLPIVKAIVASALKGSYNTLVNLYKDSDKLIELDEDQAIIYTSELEWIQNRLSELLALSESHISSNVDEQIEVQINMQPKFIAAVTHVDAPIYKRFLDEDYGFGIDLNALWTKLNDEFSVNTDNVTKDNIVEFSKRVFKWRQSVYEAIKAKYPSNTEINERFKKFLSTDGEGRITVGRDAGKYNNDPNTQVTSLGAVTYLMNIIGIDQNVLNGYIKSTLNRDEDYPFDNQIMAITTGIVGSLNPMMANAITDAMIVSNDAVAEGKDFIENMPRLHNLVAILGGTGTGKSKICTPWIIKILKKIDPSFDVIGTTKYGERLSELKTELGISKIEALDTIISEAVGKSLSPDDYMDSQKTGHPTKLSKEFLDKIDSTKLSSKFDKDSRGLLIIDEGTYASEGELQILCAIAEKLNIGLILSGDLHQQYAVRPYKSGDDILMASTGLEDCWYLATPTLATSMRSANKGMRQINNSFDTLLDKYETVAKEYPAKQNRIPADDVINISLPNYESGSGFYGGKVITNDVSDWIQKFKNFASSLDTKQPRIGIITDSDKYDSYKSEDVTIIRPNEVQGQEFDYVIIDIDLSNDIYKDLYVRLKSLNTWFGRAKRGFVINDDPRLKERNFNITNESPNVNASQSIDAKRDRLEQLEKYKDIVDQIYADVNTSKASEPEEAKGKSEEKSGSEESGTGNSGRLHTIVHQNEDFEKVKQEVIDETLNGNENSSSHKDEDHYRQHNALLNDSTSKERKYSLEQFWRWLHSDASDNVIFGPYSIFEKGVSEDSRKEKAKEAIQQIVYAIVTSKSNEERRKAISELEDSLDGILSKDFISDLKNSFDVEKWRGFSVRRYTDTESMLWYVFQGKDNKYAIPMGPTTQWSTNSNYADIIFTEDIPLALLSSKGRVSTSISNFANKVNVHRQNYLFAPPRSGVSYDSLSTPAKGFRRSTGRLYTIIDLAFGRVGKELDSDLLTPIIENGNVVDFSKLTDTTIPRIGGTHRRIPYKEYSAISRVLAKLFAGGASQETKTEAKNIIKSLYPADSSKKLRSKNGVVYSFDDIIDTIAAGAESLNKQSNAEHNIDRYEWLRRLEVLNWESRANLFGALFRIANEWYKNSEPGSKESKWAGTFMGNVLREYLLETKDSDNPSSSGNLYRSGLEINLNGSDSDGYDKQLRLFIYPSGKSSLKFNVDLVNNEGKTISITDPNGPIELNLLNQDTGIQLNTIVSAVISAINNYSVDIAGETVTGLAAFDINLPSDFDKNIDESIANSVIQVIPMSKRINDTKTDGEKRNIVAYYVAGDQDFGRLLPGDDDLLPLEDKIDAELRKDKVFNYGIYRGENRYSGEPVNFKLGSEDFAFFYKIESDTTDVYTVDYVDMMLPSYNTDSSSVQGKDETNRLINGFFQSDEHGTTTNVVKEGESYKFTTPKTVSSEQLKKALKTLVGDNVFNNIIANVSDLSVTEINIGLNPYIMVGGDSFKLESINESEVKDFLNEIGAKIIESNSKIIVQNNNYKIYVNDSNMAVYSDNDGNLITLDLQSIIDVYPTAKHVVVIKDGDRIFNLELSDSAYSKMPQSFKDSIKFRQKNGTEIGVDEYGNIYYYRNGKIRVGLEDNWKQIIGVDEAAKKIHVLDQNMNYDFWYNEQKIEIDYDTWFAATEREHQSFKPESKPVVNKNLVQNIASILGMNQSEAETLISDIKEDENFVTNVNQRLREIAPKLGRYLSIKQSKKGYVAMQNTSPYANAWLIINNAYGNSSNEIVQTTTDENSLIQEFTVEATDGNIFQYKVVFDKKGKYEIMQQNSSALEPINIVKEKIEAISDPEAKKYLEEYFNSHTVGTELSMEFNIWQDQHPEYDDLIEEIDNLEKEKCDI